jgi:carboxypeptidase family protein
MLAATSTGWGAATAATVTGVVRDGQGVAQMGALVQILANGSLMAGTALTDLHGRYLISNLVPGKYEVRATAALFMPAMHGNLQLRPGGKAVVNLTLNALFDTSTWLPAERRKVDEPSDDWKWTLSSVANRPILRMVEDGDIVMVSSSASENKTAVDHAKASMSTGDGGFGTGGVHNVYALDRVMPDRSNIMVRADIGSSTGPLFRAPSTDVAAGYERQLGFTGAARTVVSYQSHPEIAGSGGPAGLYAAQLASAQKTKFGDTVELETGGIIYVVRTVASAVASRPFLRVTAHPNENWSFGYRMATSRNLQSFAGLDSVEMELPVAVLSEGRMETESGLHQEWNLGRKTGRGIVQVAYYRDNLNRVALSGSGELGLADLADTNGGPAGTNGVLADTATGTFRMLGNGYSSQGINILLTEPVAPGLWLAVEYSTGAGLVADGSSGKSLSAVSAGLKPRSAQTATLALKGNVVHSGTKVRASYRWQPERFVSAVNSYAPFGDQAYLSFFIRQPIRCGGLLPPGLEASIDVTNLLQQGYRPFLSADGRTLYLAQSPRVMQAGLAFNF